MVHSRRVSLEFILVLVSLLCCENSSILLLVLLVWLQVSSLLGFPIMRMTPTPIFAVFLVLMYLVYLSLAILVECGIVDIGDIPGICNDC